MTHIGTGVRHAGSTLRAPSRTLPSIERCDFAATERTSIGHERPQITARSPPTLDAARSRGRDPFERETGAKVSTEKHRGDGFRQEERMLQRRITVSVTLANELGGGGTLEPLQAVSRIESGQVQRTT